MEIFCRACTLLVQWDLMGKGKDLGFGNGLDDTLDERFWKHYYTIATGFENCFDSPLGY